MNGLGFVCCTQMKIKAKYTPAPLILDGPEPKESHIKLLIPEAYSSNPWELEAYGSEFL